MIMMKCVLYVNDVSERGQHLPMPDISVLSNKKNLFFARLIEILQLEQAQI
jgi:hypothetical protein